MTLPRRLTDLAGLPAAAFIRVSTDQQQLSPPAQRRGIERFAQDHGINIVIDKELTISGRDAWRDPAVIEITEAAEAGRIRAVIVSTLDRMGRSPRTDIFIDDLEHAGAVLVDAENEMISGNRAHRRSMRTGIAAAGNEREIIGDRVTGGIQQRWNEYSEPWGFAPVGFRRETTVVDPATGKHLQRMHIDPDTMPEVIALFERYASGVVSIDLLAESAPTLTVGRYAGQRMTREGVADMLANPVYNGWVSFKGDRRPAPWRGDPPVSDELWEHVQQVRATRTRAGGTQASGRVNLFEGLLVCGDCGQRLRLDGFGGTGRPYHRLRHVAPCARWGRAQRKPLATWQEPLLAQISAVEVSPAVIADVVAHLSAGSSSPSNELRRRREQQQVANDLIVGAITGTQAQERLDAIRAEAATIPTPRPTVTATQVRSALENLRETWRDADGAARAQLIHAIYARIPIHGDGRFGQVELTPSATAKGLPRALPEQVQIATGGYACPRGLEPPTFRSAT